jgi:Flp pilus assembly protein TadB
VAAIQTTTIRDASVCRRRRYKPRAEFHPASAASPVSPIDALVQAALASQAAQAAFDETAATTVNVTDATITPWIASAASWLMVIVWIIWGVGMCVGLAATFLAQWLLGRFVGKAG